MPKDENTKTETRATEPAPRPMADASNSKLSVPEGDVLVRFIGPASEAQDALVGGVVRGRVYTVSMTVAAARCLGENPKFEPAYADDRMRIEAASKAAQKKD